mmetsp:Transcript_28591/g.57109  ORF Transcript_28591/g.57109 Transcript_28591/m.57109 type:complete len:88 (-) Transcript_28591:1505-1768(-)
MIQDLITEIKLKQEAGNQSILGIDANEILEVNSTTVKKYSITKLKHKCGLTDVYKYQHNQILGGVYCFRSQDRLLRHRHGHPLQKGG